MREDAYVDFMHDRFGGVPPGYLERCPNTLAGGDAALRRLLELPEPPSAVATSTDLVAVGACTPPTASAPPCPSGCRWWATTTS